MQVLRRRLLPIRRPLPLPARGTYVNRLSFICLEQGACVLTLYCSERRASSAVNATARIRDTARSSPIRRRV